MRGLLVLVVVCSTGAFVPLAAAKADAGVIDVETADRATPGESVPIEVAVALPEAEGVDVVVNVSVVVSVDGERIDRRYVEVGDGESVSFNVTHQFEPGGTRTVTADANTTFHNRNVSASDATEIRAVGQVLPGQSRPARDLDRDGRTEDIDGNGRLDVIDVSKFLAVLRDVSQDQQDLVDFNADGKIDVLDVAELLKKVR